MIRPLQFLEESLQSWEEQGSKEGIETASIRIGETAFLNKDYVMAYRHLERGLKLALELKTKELIKDGYFAMYQLFSLKEDYKIALDYYKLYSDLTNELY